MIVSDKLELLAGEQCLGSLEHWPVINLEKRLGGVEGTILVESGKTLI